jgi:hypothetical protein
VNHVVSRKRWETRSATRRVTEASGGADGRRAAATISAAAKCMPNAARSGGAWPGGARDHEARSTLVGELLMSEPREPFVELEARLNLSGMDVLDRLKQVRSAHGAIGVSDLQTLAQESALPVAALAGAASFYADTSGRRGRRHVQVCEGTSCVAVTGGGMSSGWSGRLVCSGTTVRQTGRSRFR